MKLIDIVESDDFEHPKIGDDEKAYWIGKKLRGIGHYVALIYRQIQQLEELKAEHKLTPRDERLLVNLKDRLQKAVGAYKPYEEPLMAQLKVAKELRIGKNKIQTPLLTCDLDHWVGRPEEYPSLHTTQVKLLAQIQAALNSSGLFPPLSIMYAGRKSKDYPGINFVATNFNQTFAWRKYDPSPGAGQNWVYIPGIGQMKTSDFVKNPGPYIARAKL